ncbi:MAG: metallophosphoesterase [Bacteroidales bacterium]|nr:metallophosphoesterase [Bacteroidales bacterium]
MIVEIVLPARSGNRTSLLVKMWLLFAYLTAYIPKYIAIIFDLIGRLPVLWHHSRIKWLTPIGIGLGIVCFCTMWWGAIINRNNLDINEISVEIEGLPDSFDGFRIAQFSDLHTGTFGTDTAFVSRLVDRLNNLNADAIVFTGDIVNRQSDEIEPFLPVLKHIDAPYGTFAILGNHDYGDYKNWESESDKRSNMQALYDSYSLTGIDLVLNDHRWIHRGNDSIALIGVENIGEPPFHTYGSLTASYPDLSDDNVKILLSHNPRHWVDSIADNPAVNIPLTLSGHTHAMQIEIAGISPACLRYPTWGGMYHDTDGRHKLYVNIGSGTVGIPMRIGATPEITVFTLRKK